jgi:thiol-disulfide isomerase/thioredoxin
MLQEHSKGAGWALLTAVVLASGFDPSRALAADRLEFELATLNGNAFVKIADFPNRAVLINIWGTECPPCVKETPLLNAQSQIYKNVQFLGIATDDRMSSLRFASRFNVRYPQLQAPKDPSGLLRRLGDPHGALPFTVVLDSQHRICAQRLGEVDAGWIAAAVRQCSAPQTLADGPT